MDIALALEEISEFAGVAFEGRLRRGGDGKGEGTALGESIFLPLDGRGIAIFAGIAFLRVRDTPAAGLILLEND